MHVKRCGCSTVNPHTPDLVVVSGRTLVLGGQRQQVLAAAAAPAACRSRQRYNSTAQAAPGRQQLQVQPASQQQYLRGPRAASGPLGLPFSQAQQAGAVSVGAAQPLAAAAVPDAPTAPAQRRQQAPAPAGGEPARRPDAGTLWGLLVLSLAYLHHSTSGFALPALLPIITEDLHLSDNQGALLTAGYTVGRTVAGGLGLIAAAGLRACGCCLCKREVCHSRTSLTINPSCLCPLTSKKNNQRCCMR